MTRPDLNQTQIIDQPSETEPALRIRRYSADATGNLVEYVDEDGTILNAVDKNGDANGGSVPGSVLPVAEASPATVDSTTYDNTLTGVGKLTTLVFPGTDAALLAVAMEGDDFPRWLIDASAPGGIYAGDGTSDPVNGANLYVAGAGIWGAGHVEAQAASAAQVPKLAQVSPKYTVTSGGLSGVTCASGTGRQISTASDVETYTIITPDASNNIASVTVELSPDDTTYTQLYVFTLGATQNAAGDKIPPVNVRVPAGWFLKITVVHASITGSTIYY